jgi:hypothetical protein
VNGASDNTVAIVAIVVSGGVALLAAILAPITAHFRQKTALKAERKRLDKQLAAERQRLDDQLAAERDRQAAQLKHDRLVRDVEELRSFLDDAAQLVAEIYGPFIGALSSSQALTQHYGTREATPDDERVDAMAAQSDARDMIKKIPGLPERIKLRLGSTHAVTEAVRELWAAYNGALSLLRFEHVVPTKNQIEKDYSAANLAIGRAEQKFIEAAHRLVQAKIDAEPRPSG